MAQPAIQTSFASGEWAPKLRSRVDIAKYHAGAELLRNFYVDYSGGGASTRQGTRFCNQAFNSAKPVRLIGFQPSPTLSYVLEFGDGYIRFFSNGSPILESSIAVTSTSGNTITTASNSYNVGDWVFIGGLYYIVTSPGATFSVSDLFGNTSVTPSGATVARVYTLASPYAATDLFPNPITGNPGIKFVQDVTSMIICHTSYQPQILTINSANSWTISAINFGATIPTPGSLTLITTLTVAANQWNYAYTVTAVDTNGQESPPATPATLTGYQNLNSLGGSGSGTTGNTNTLSWATVPGAVSYNVYKASPVWNATIPTGAPYGFIGNTTALSFQDATPGIGADFSQTPPVPQNPFLGAGVQSYTVTEPGAYTTVPTVTVAAPPAGGYQATAQESLGILTYNISSGGSGFQVGDICNVQVLGHAIFSIKVLTVNGIGAITSSSLYWPGSITAGSTPTLNYPIKNPHPSGSNGTINAATWGVLAVNPIQQGAGYTTPPGVTFSAGIASANANLATAGGGNPGVPGFIQTRLALGGLTQAVQNFDLSQPGSFFNFNNTNPIVASDAINGQIISEQLNDIRSFVAVPTGLLAFTGRTSWLINGGGGISTQNPMSPANVTAQPQSFNGASDIPPLRVNFDLLYVTNKGNYVRDLSYNVWQQLFTGNDISVLSNHLFFGHYLLDWAWCEEPFKTVWATRDDGQLLSLAYVKEQELIGWAHHDTFGQFKSVCTVYETIGGNTVDAVYVVVQRFVNGQYVQYIERMADRYFTYGAEDSWSVDAALQTAPAVMSTTTLTFTGNGSAVGNSVVLSDPATAPFLVGQVGWSVRAAGGIYKITAFTSSSQVTAQVVRVSPQISSYGNTPFPAIGYTIWQPVTTVSGLTQLEGQTVTGTADGVVVSPRTVSAGGSVTLDAAATKVTLGLAFQPQMKTLRLDLGQPTVQSKRKKIPAVTMRVADTLGLSIGTSFANAISMKDFTIGNLNQVDNVLVSDLYSGDGRTILDQLWQEPGQFVIQQNLPYPATILGVMPEFGVGDTPNARSP